MKLMHKPEVIYKGFKIKAYWVWIDVWIYFVYKKTWLLYYKEIGFFGSQDEAIKYIDKQ